MEPLEGDQALLDGEGPLEHDDPYIARARDGAARLELGRGDPAVLIPHPAEQRHVRLPDHAHAVNGKRRVHPDRCITGGYDGCGAVSRRGFIKRVGAVAAASMLQVRVGAAERRAQLDPRTCEIVKRSDFRAHDALFRSLLV